jgi:hypothetical protein
MKAKYVWEFIAQHGGRAALEGLTTTQVCELFLKPATEAHKCSMCEVLRLSGREDLTGVARLFISHAWQYGFLQVCDAVWAFLVREHGSEAAAGEEIIWFDLFSNSQHNTGDKPFEWWTGTFMNAIKTMGSVLMMSPWDNPVTLKRAWCVFEVYACVSTGSRFEVGMTDEENARFLTDILDEPERYYKMLGTISSAKATAYVTADRDAIFEAIELTVPRNAQTGRFEVVARLQGTGRAPVDFTVLSPVTLRAVDPPAAPVNAAHRDSRLYSILDHNSQFARDRSTEPPSWGSKA